VVTNLFLFQFFPSKRPRKVIKQGSWSFDYHTLVLGLLQQGGIPSVTCLNRTPFWVQVHQVQVWLISEKVGTQFIDFILENTKQKNNSYFLKTYMRLQISLK
jgi:hypothetical protein